MYKIWARTQNKDKVAKSLIYKGEGDFEIRNFVRMLRDICEQMDIPTPVVLRSHTKNFDAFNVTRFLPDDFVEHVDFDSFYVEFCRDDASEKRHLYKAYLPTD